VKQYGGPQKKIKKNFGLFFSFLSQNYVNLGCFHKMFVQKTWQCIYNPTHWGPQKIFRGPHAARGPEFGHLCYIAYNLSARNIIPEYILSNLIFIQT